MTQTATTASTRHDSVVIDMMPNRNLAPALFRRVGLRTRKAEGGKTARPCRASKRTPVDLRLLDISMPELNGEEVCHQLRADTTRPTSKIVAWLFK